MKTVKAGIAALNITVMGILALPTLANASVVLDFDGVPFAGGSCPQASVVEQGFTIGNCPENNNRPGTIHLDDAGTGFMNMVSFSGPGTFDALSVTITAHGWNFANWMTGRRTPYDNLLFEGYRSGGLIAAQSFSTFGFTRGETRDVNFSTDFTDIDYLTITELLPSALDMLAYPDSECMDYPCTHVDLARIEFAAVPLPATALGLMAGLLGLGAVSARRRRRADT